VIRQFLADHPGLRVGLRGIRGFLKGAPILGPFFIRLERRYLATTAKERYEADDPFDAHEYFRLYASIIVSQVKGDVLDLGCGHGYLTEMIAREKAVQSVVGIDKISDFRCKHPKVSYLTADITQLRDLPKRFDTIVSTEFIEHISPCDLENLLSLVKEHLAPGGAFIGSTPNGRYPSGDPYHSIEYTESTIRVLLERFFDNVEVKPLRGGCLIFRGVALANENSAHD
jgi:2-polyprenyl-3-methyl-5-hydroxy-6-metoxy-1,4-benzoquinol methylase